jgi:adenosylhomocysteine nucleosidase
LRLLGLVGAVVVSFLVGLSLGGLIMAAIHGYIVAARAYCLGLKVIGISYVNQQGQMVNESGPAFEEEFYSEYSYSAAAKYLLAANRVID